jgi:hypothetical protein
MDESQTIEPLKDEQVYANAINNQGKRKKNDMIIC